jgi:hypothetical protein
MRIDVENKEGRIRREEVVLDRFGIAVVQMMGE